MKKMYTVLLALMGAVFLVMATTTMVFAAPNVTKVTAANDQTTIGKFAVSAVYSGANPATEGLGINLAATGGYNIGPDVSLNNVSSIISSTATLEMIQAAIGKTTVTEAAATITLATFSNHQANTGASAAVYVNDTSTVLRL